MIYGEFDDFGWFWAVKNKAKQSQLQMVDRMLSGFPPSRE